ncbi:MED14-domain-containing protein [Trametopsis cervina]|nr:MED14-domain-containing protein [Trametopsis cervina]
MTSVHAHATPSTTMEEPLNTHFNGIPNGLPHIPSEEQLDQQLPFVNDGQAPLAELVSRMSQAMFAELTELAETMPHMSDNQRKRTLAEWVVKTKKQVVKLYAVVKWSRDATVVQKAMNVTAFLMDQNRQFEEAINGLKYTKDNLDPARLRNHDLLTSLDVLTTGSYRRLPSAIKTIIIPPEPLSSDKIADTLSAIEDVMRYRLRMHELIPCEMDNYRIADGRVYFTAPKLFEVSLCVKGAKSDDGWFFVDVDFLFTVGGDATGMQEFPRKPTGPIKRHIADEADGRLGFYLPVPDTVPLPPEGQNERQKHQLPDGVFDSPLVRLYNFLQMMSMSYQLEILWYQAERLRSLGWAEYLTVQMSNDRRTLTLSYWIRKPPPAIPGRPPPRSKIPLFGGTLTISIIPTQPAPPTTVAPSSQSSRITQSQPSQLVHSQSSSQQPTKQAPMKPHRSPRDRVLAELQERAKLGGRVQSQDVRSKPQPSDEVESMKFSVTWEPQRTALGVQISVEDAILPPGELLIDADNLDVESLLRKVIWQHTKATLTMFQLQLQRGPYKSVFGPPGEVDLVTEEGALALRTHLCSDEVVIITIDPRTGRISMRDTGDLAAAGRGPKFSAISEAINMNPIMLPGALVQFRFSTITDLAEQKANYLGLRCFRQRNFSRDELQKLGPAARSTLYIQLATFPYHYLVLVVTDEEFRYALISVKERIGSMYAELIMEDIGWLDVNQIHGDDVIIKQQSGLDELGTTGEKRPRSLYELDAPKPIGFGEQRASASFRLETQLLRELYAYCCARVAYTKVEMQLKSRGITYKHVTPTSPLSSPAVLAHMHSSLARSIPSLCVQSSDILSGAPAAEAAMPNIRIIPLNWWSDQKPQVVTCVKLKYVQQPVGKRAGSGAVIRPSKRIIYDTREAIVTFLSEDVDKCVDEFSEEWARVSKMVVIAREVAQMAVKYKWSDVRLLSFDLQTVEFSYTAGYTVSITCVDQLSPTGGSFELSFARGSDGPDVVDESTADVETILSQYNPHEDVEPFLRDILRKAPLAQALHRLVALLRDTLPIVAELEYIRVKAEKAGDDIDTFAKTAGWFRVLYGDLRHALDFRLMSNAQVLVMDGSNSAFNVGERATTSDNSLLLHPIPDFPNIVSEARKDIGTSTAGRRSVSIDMGMVCHSSVVGIVGRALHERILASFKDKEPGKVTAA